MSSHHCPANGELTTGTRLSSSCYHWWDIYLSVCLAGCLSGCPPEKQLISGRLNTSLSSILLCHWHCHLCHGKTSICMCLMLHTCALQEGGVITDQAPPHPVKQKSYTEGQSYDTASGRVITMTSSDNCFTLNVDTGWADRQVRGMPLHTADDVTTGGRLITIREVTPTSPRELRPGACDAVRDVSGEGGSKGGGPTNVTPAVTPLLLPSALPDKLRSTHSPGHLSGRMPPSLTSMVCCV